MMSQRRTPEEVVCEMSFQELRDLLSELSMDASLEAAVRFKRLVRRIGRLEDAIETLGGPATMKRVA